MRLEKWFLSSVSFLKYRDLKNVFNIFHGISWKQITSKQASDLVIEYKDALDVVHILSKEVYSHKEGKVVEVAGIKQCDHIRHSTWSEK